MEPVTPVTCIDGKKHNWREILKSRNHRLQSDLIIKWCKKCGCYSEWHKDRYITKPRRYIDPGTKEEYIEVPDYLPFESKHPIAD